MKLSIKIQPLFLVLIGMTILFTRTFLMVENNDNNNNVENKNNNNDNDNN